MPRSTAPWTFMSRDGGKLQHAAARGADLPVRAPSRKPRATSRAHDARAEDRDSEGRDCAHIR